MLSMTMALSSTMRIVSIESLESLFVRKAPSGEKGENPDCGKALDNPKGSISQKIIYNNSML